MKKLGLILSFYAVFLIQLHAIVPHDHSKETNCHEAELQEEQGFLHLLEHFFMFDLGEDHFEHFTASSDLGPFNFDFTSLEIRIPFPEIMTKVFKVPVQEHISSSFQKDFSGRAPPHTV